MPSASSNEPSETPREPRSARPAPRHAAARGAAHPARRPRRRDACNAAAAAVATAVAPSSRPGAATCRRRSRRGGDDRRRTPDRIAVGGRCARSRRRHADARRSAPSTAGRRSRRRTSRPAAGVTYALSTAPGVAGQSGRSRPGDLPHHATASTGTPPTRARRGSPTSSEHDGVLYAVGTAPGAVGVRRHVPRRNVERRRPRTGAKPTCRSISARRPRPFRCRASSLAQIARGAHATVALLTEQFSPDLRSLTAQYEHAGRQIDTRAD